MPGDYVADQVFSLLASVAPSATVVPSGDPISQAMRIIAETLANAPGTIPNGSQDTITYNQLATALGLTPIIGADPESYALALILGGAIGGGYQPAIARPSVAGVTYTVNTGMTPAAIAAVYAGCNSGDCIQFADGTYDQNLCFPSGYNRAGVIIRAQNIGAYDADPLGDGGTRHWARFSRSVVFELGADVGGTPSQISADNVTIHDIHFTTRGNLWPAENQNWNSTVNNLQQFGLSLSNFGMLAIATGVQNTDILYNEFSMGYGPTKIPFDPTVKYLDANSPAMFSLGTGGAISSGGSYVGWGDATWLTYNRMLWGPYAILGNRVGANARIYGNYFHDVSHCINSILPSGGVYVQRHNWFERSYHDFGTISSNVASSPLISIDQNIWIDPCGHPSDNANPHIDTNQIFWSITGGGVVRPMLITSSRNLLMVTGDTVRGASQINFFQLSGAHYAASNTNDIISIASKVRENISLHSGYSPALELGVSEDMYVRGNIAFHRSALNNNTTPVATQATIDKSYNAVSARQNEGYFADNIFEADVDGPGASYGLIADLDKRNNAIMGRRDTRTITEATIFQGYTASCPTTPHQMFQYVRRNPGYTQGTSLISIAAFTLGDMDWGAETPFLGFVDLVGQAASTVVTSNPAWVHGGNAGQSRTVTPGAGVEWRYLGTDRTTVLADWSATSGAVAVDGGYVQLRVTSPAQGQAATFSVTMGGVAHQWMVLSASTALFSRVRFDGADRFVRSAGALGSDGPLVSVALKMRFPSANPATTQVYGTITGNGAVQVQILNTGLIRLNIRDAAGTIIAVLNQTGASLCDGNVHEIFMTADLSQSVAANGRTVVVDGVDVTSATGTWAGGAGVTIGYSRTAGPIQYAFGGTAALMIADTDVDYCWMSINERIDATSGMVRSKFAADQIGATGAGPTGASPILFLTGNAATWNDVAGINKGTGAKYIAAAGSAVTDV